MPSSRDLLLLKGAVLPRKRALLCLREWEKGAGFVAVEPEVRALLSHLFPVMEGLPKRSILRTPIQKAYEANWFRNQIVLKDLEFISKILKKAEMSFLVLKGAALLRSTYRDIGVRAVGDIDILIPREKMPRALSHFGKIGYRPATYRAAKVQLHLQYDKAENLFHPTRTPLDIHFYLSRALKDDLLNDAIWKTAKTHHLDPTFQFFHLVAHNLFGQAKELHWILDSVQYFKKYRSQIDWKKIAEWADQRNISWHLSQIFELFRKELGVPVPKQVLRNPSKSIFDSVSYMKTREESTLVETALREIHQYALLPQKERDRHSFFDFITGYHISRKAAVIDMTDYVRRKMFGAIGKLPTSGQNFAKTLGYVKSLGKRISSLHFPH